MRTVRQYRPYRYGSETVRYAHENGPYRTALLGGRTVRTAAAPAFGIPRARARGSWGS